MYRTIKRAGGEGRRRLKVKKGWHKGLNGKFLVKDLLKM